MIFIFSKNTKQKKTGRTLIICTMFTFCFRITVSEVRCHMIKHWCSLEMLISVRLTSHGTGIHFKGYKNAWKLKVLIQNVERSRMYSLYSAYVMLCHCCMFTENYNFNICGFEWDRKIIITVFSDHLNHAQCRRLVYFSFTKKRWPNGHVTAATAHHHVSRVAALVLQIYLNYHHLLTHAIMPIFNWFEKTIQAINLFKSFNPPWSYKVFYIKLITNSMTLV